MAVMNAVQILMLLWSLTAVCQADAGVCSVSCDNVTATVGNEVILTCRVSEQCIEEHVKLHKFQSLKTNSEYCKEEHPNNTCETKKTFTCSYTPDTAKETFRFFLQTTSSRKEPEFTVEISDNQYQQGGNPGPEKSNVSAVSAGVGCIIILIIIIILTIIIIYKKQTGGCQKMMFLGTREKDHDRDTEKVENHF